MTKKVGVLFSGGLDSTYLVWKNLVDGNGVIPIYVEITNNRNKSILEKNRIKLLHKEFEKEFNTSTETLIRNIQYRVKIDVDAPFEDSLYFKQVPIWLLATLFSQNLDVDELQIGYVMNDDAISYLDDIQKVYQSYGSLLKYMKPLVFPLKKDNKNYMFRDLPSKYSDNIISCENASIIGPEDAEVVKYEPCCECVPCSHIIASDYYGTGKFPNNYKKNLIHNYVKKITDNGYDVIDKEGKKYELWPDKINKQPYQLSFDFDCGSNNNKIPMPMVENIDLKSFKSYNEFNG